MKCIVCGELAAVALPSHKSGFCPEHFQHFFSRQVDRAIRRYKLCTKEDKILVAMSGGKDSLALSLELKEQGYDVSAMHVDLDIPGSSEHAAKACKAFCMRHSIPFYVVHVAEHGLSIPLVKKRIKRPVCSACGKIKRYFFNRFALENGFDVLATGHNLDDEVSRLFSNLLNWKTDYLSDQGPLLQDEEGFARKIKPLCRLTEFETAAYCYLKNIDVVTAPCPYSKGATFTLYKTFWRHLEREQPGRKLHFYEGFLSTGRAVFDAAEQRSGKRLSPCAVCSMPTSSEICGVCRMQEMVSRHQP